MLCCFEVASGRADKLGFMRWVALFVLGAVSGLTGCTERRTSDRYLIPQGYTGWIVVQYGVAGAPATPLENGFLLYSIPRNGRLKTSSTLLYGRGKDEFYYVSPTGQRQPLANTISGGGLIWGESVGSKETHQGQLVTQSPVTKTFFVGTEKQFNKAGPKPSY